MKFRCNYEKSCAVPEPQCPFELQDYEYDKSTRQLVPTKKIEFYKEIQSYYDSTRIDVKLSKFAMGDFTALGTPGGSYGDFTDIPTNLAQVLNAKSAAESSFSKLPLELRKLFNNDYAEFIKCIEDGTYQEKLIKYAGILNGGSSNGGSSNGGSSDPASTNTGGNQ